MLFHERDIIHELIANTESHKGIIFAIWSLSLFQNPSKCFNVSDVIHYRSIKTVIRIFINALCARVNWNLLHMAY